MTAQPSIYRDGDLTLHGELYRPAGANHGRAVLVVHEADGIGGNVRRRCATLAELGYTAFAADMHGGGRVLDAGEIPAAMAVFRNDPALLRRRVRCAFDALIAACGLPAAQVFAIGYCFGGLAVLELARDGAVLAGVASFHGLLTSAAPAELGTIKTRILACTGARDPLVPLTDVATFSGEMAAAGADWQMIVYGRALHSFTNPGVGTLGDPRMAYNPAADASSWAALLRFMDEAPAAR